MRHSSKKIRYLDHFFSPSLSPPTRHQLCVVCSFCGYSLLFYTAGEIALRAKSEKSHFPEINVTPATNGKI